ncbi:SAVED domain-containing protein [Leifsonia lichenia]
MPADPVSNGVDFIESGSSLDSRGLIVSQPHQMPSPTGVRIAGDEYQWLHVWRACLQILHDQVNGSANPGASVGVEEPGVGNGDDLVIHRAAPPHSYGQVKYTVDASTPVNLDYLKRSGVLKKLVATHQALTADGTPCEIRLVTNRGIDSADVLLRDRDGRDGRLVPRAAQGGPNSIRGVARKEWADAAEVDEDALLAFLNVFYLDLGFDVERLRQEVSLLMTANGLKSDPASVTLATNWVHGKVISGQRELFLADIKSAIAELGLLAGTPWTTASIATLAHDPLADQALAAVDWVDRMDGDSPWNRVQPEPPNTFEDLARDLDALIAGVGTHRRVLLTGSFRQATGFYVGSVFRQVLGYDVAIRQRADLWSSEAPTPSFAVAVEERDLAGGDDVAIVANIATEITDDVATWVRDQDLPVGKLLALTPAHGAGPNAVNGPGDGHGLAIAIRDLARRNASGGGRTHLFLAGPLGLSILLGHHWSRVGTTEVYEDTRPGYVLAYEVIG